jgi:xylulokinase
VYHVARYSGRLPRERINRELGSDLLSRARNRAGPDWTAAQLAWVRECEPSAWRRARRLLFAKDYLRFWLTGERNTDHIDAEGSLLLNAGTRTWDRRLCDAVPVDPGWLPAVLAPGAPAGFCARAGVGDHGSAGRRPGDGRLLGHGG